MRCFSLGCKMSRKLVLSVGGLVVIALVIITLIFRHKAPDSKIYTVIDIDDNLLLNINNGKEQQRIRLCGVDVPSGQTLSAKTLINKELEPVDSVVSVVFNNGTAEIFIKTDSGIDYLIQHFTT